MIETKRGEVLAHGKVSHIIKYQFKLDPEGWLCGKGSRKKSNSEGAALESNENMPSVYHVLTYLGVAIMKDLVGTGKKGENKK